MSPREQVLPEVPGLGGLYGKALGRTVRAALPQAMTSATPPPHTLPEVTYRVEDVDVPVATLADYQHLLGEPGTDTLPPGFVHVLGFPLAMALMVRTDFPLPVMGMVHVANTITQRHPLSAQDRLHVRTWAQHLRAHRSDTQVDLVVEVSGADGPEAAWRGVSTYLAKGHTLPGLALAEPAGQGPGDGRGPVDGRGPADGRGPGDEDAADPKDLPVTAQWRLRADTGRRYATVSGDRNPIHLSALSAKAFGFPKAIAHGMYTAARALAAVGPARGEAFTWDVQFAKPVLLPSTVALNLSATDGGSYRYTGWNLRNGKPHFSGMVRPLP